MDAVLGQGYDKGTGTKGKSWGKGQGQKGGSWGKGKGAYGCEDDGWNNWSPQMLLKIVPAVDPEGFSAPRKPAAKKAAPHHQTQVETRNRFSHLPTVAESNEDIPLNLCEGEPYPALKACTQEAKAKEEIKTALAVIPSPVPQAFEASACLSPLSGKRV